MTPVWTISSLDRRTSDGFVTTAHWQCSGVDGDGKVIVEPIKPLPIEPPTFNH